MDRTDLDGDPSGTWPLVGQTNVQIHVPTGPQYNRLSDYSHDACKMHVQRSVIDLPTPAESAYKR